MPIGHLIEVEQVVWRNQTARIEATFEWLHVNKVMTFGQVEYLSGGHAESHPYCVLCLMSYVPLPMLFSCTTFYDVLLDRLQCVFSCTSSYVVLLYCLLYCFPVPPPMLFSCTTTYAVLLYHILCWSSVPHPALFFCTASYAVLLHHLL